MSDDPMKEIKVTLEKLARGDTEKTIKQLSAVLKKLKDQKKLDPKVLAMQKMLQDMIGTQKMMRSMLNKVIKNIG